MQFNKLSLLLFFISLVLAVPADVTMTQYVEKETTVMVRGYVYVTNGQTLTTFYTDNGDLSTATAAPAQITAQPTPVAEDTTVFYFSSEEYMYESVSTFLPTFATGTLDDIDINSYFEQEAAATTTTLEPTSSATKVSSAPSVSATTSVTTDGLSDNASKLLTVHNNKRALHKDTPPLKWSSELETYAQNYANQYDCSGGLVHSGGPYGENLAIGYGIEGAVEAWYDEIKYYDYNNPGFSGSTGHFTQVVWKSSTEVGCGIKNCGSTWGDYVICSYKPAGNVIGEFPENVMPLA